MTGTFRDFIPAGEDTGGLGGGFRDFVAPKVPNIPPEELLRLRRIAALEKARAAKKAKQTE